MPLLAVKLLTIVKGWTKVSCDIPDLILSVVDSEEEYLDHLLAGYST